MKRILDTQPEFYSAQPPDYIEAAIIPALEAGKLVVTCEKRSFFTVARPVHLPSGPARPEVFMEDGPLLWIVDLVSMPCLPWMSAGLAMRRAIVHKGLAQDGEVVAFWRHRTRRYNHFIARRRNHVVPV